MYFRIKRDFNTKLLGTIHITDHPGIHSTTRGNKKDSLTKVLKAKEMVYLLLHQTKDPEE